MNLLDDFIIGKTNNFTIKKTTQTTQTNSINIKKPIIWQIYHSNFNKQTYLKNIHIPIHTTNSPDMFFNEYLNYFTRTKWVLLFIVLIIL